MKLVNFINTFKFSLAGTIERVSDWKIIFLWKVDFPLNEGDNITFTFCNNSSPEPGSLAIASSVSESAICKECTKSYALKLIDSSYDYFELARHFKNTNDSINSAGRFLVILDVLSNQINSLLCDGEYDITDVNFITNKDLVEFTINNKSVLTDGVIVNFGSLL